MSKGGGSSQTTTQPKREGWFQARLKGNAAPGFDGSTGILPTADATFANQAANPINPTMQQGLQGIEQLASQGSPVGQSAQNVLLNLLNKGAPSQDFANQAMQGGMVNPALAETQRVAMGGDLGSNPYLDQTFNNAARQVGQSFRENVIPGLDRAAQDAGRTGSGQYALLRNRTEEGLANQLGDMATSIYGGAYEADQNRRMGMLGQFGAMGQQGIANQFAGAGLANEGTRQQLAGIGLGGQAFDLQAQPYNALIGAGQLRDDQAWRPLQQYSGLLNQNSTAGTITQMPQPSTNPIAGGLAGGLGAASMAAQMGLGGPWMAGLGALGGAAGLWSDKRLKTDIKRVGKTDGGLPIHTYKYKGDEDGPTLMGVLAQEVKKKRPDAVVTHPDGLMSVLYERVA
jgi:hypothetical protein